ncbi:ABC transporter permease [Pilimelia columellifera]|uniref:ABC transporter permease n=1 Tax=Pilimelia columellifera subsp. columellifera TaxID=706583 RepID=A0ABP6AVQ1_9ACTN
MVWITWRQHRAFILFGLGLFALGGILLFWSASDAPRYLAASGNGPCPGRDCAWFANFLQGLVRGGAGLVSYVGPLIVGAVLGAPLVAREVERGTHRVAWTQSVSRNRWLWTKVGLLGLPVAVAGLVTAQMVAPWFSTVKGMSGRPFQDVGYFNATGVLPVAFLVFALIVGVFFSAAIRRAIPAMGATVAVLALTFGVLTETRDSLMKPVTVPGREYYSTAGSPVNTIWVADYVRDAAGRRVTNTSACDGAAVVVQERAATWDASPTEECYAKHGWQNLVDYHPADRYWRFQLITAGILAGLTGLFAVGAVLAMRRRD